MSVVVQKEKKRKKNKGWNWNFSEMYEWQCEKGVWLHSKCDSCGREYLIYTFCNREDCLVCGLEGSYAHYRRMARGVKKILRMVEGGG